MFLKIFQINLSGLFRNLRYLLMSLYYSKGQSKRLIKEFNWNDIPFNRIAIINSIIVHKNDSNLRYLEIGCNQNETFNSIPLLNKTGVDPIQGGNVKKTSDEFFSSNQDFFDIIFIDGLHTYDQVKKDMVNALNYLNDDGYVLIHDMLPVNWKQQHVPQLSNDWTGDGWKIINDLLNSSGLEFKIITVNFGVAVIRKINHEFKIPNTSHQTQKLNFDFYLNHVSKFPLISFEEFQFYLLSNKKSSN